MSATGDAAAVVDVDVDMVATTTAVGKVAATVEDTDRVVTG